MKRILALLLAVAPAGARPQPTASAPPLALERAIEIAVANQPQLAGARAQTRAARARAGQTTAGLLPQASGTAGVARTSDSDRWSLGVSGSQLLQAMGVTGPLDFETSPEPYPPLADEDGSLDALLAEALAARPEVAAQARQRAAQEATLRSVRGAFAPSLAATARIDGAGARPDELDRTWSAGLTLTWPFLEGGRTRAEADEARATLAALEAQEETLRQQIRLELEEARLAVRAARASLEASGEVVTSARERLRLAEGRYRAGLGSGIELNDAQVSLTNAEAQEVRARFTLASARARLARALGRG